VAASNPNREEKERDKDTPKSADFTSKINDIWVSTDEISDILLLSGISASEETVEIAIKEMRHFLPGISTGKVSFHELLVMYFFHVENPSRQADNVVGNTYKLLGKAPSSSAAARKRDIDEEHYDETHTSLLSAMNANGKTTSKKTHDNDNVSDNANATASSSRVYFSSSKAAAAVDTTKQHEHRLKVPSRQNNSSSGAVKAASGWHPTEELFRSLDILKENKLSFLSLKTALELRDEAYDDRAIMSWIQVHDRSGKGYMDLNDFLRTQYFITPLSTDHPRHHRPQSEEDRTNILRKAFSRYDLDHDGYITVDDLREAFSLQNRYFTESDLLKWIDKRDSQGKGGVSFQDFIKHYK
jgi:Ca2+-binding EF-hand superfamily protein